MLRGDILFAIGGEDDVEKAGLHQLVDNLDTVPKKMDQIRNEALKNLDKKLKPSVRSCYIVLTSSKVQIQRGNAVFK
jgi:hypothetical protein